VSAYVTYSGDDPAGYALAANVQRRNLSTSQRYMIMEQAWRLNGAKARKLEFSKYEAEEMSKAATVIDHAPDLAADVAAGTIAPTYADAWTK
jgi:hypothetical protein